MNHLEFTKPYRPLKLADNTATRTGTENSKHSCMKTETYFTILLPRSDATLLTNIGHLTCVTSANGF